MVPEPESVNDRQDAFVCVGNSASRKPKGLLRLLDMCPEIEAKRERDANDRFLRAQPWLHHMLG